MRRKALRVSGAAQRPRVALRAPEDRFHGAAQNRDPGSLLVCEATGAPDQRCTTALRLVPHRARET